MLKSMLVNKHVKTWHLIGWHHARQPITSHVRISLLTDMEFNMEFCLVIHAPDWKHVCNGAHTICCHDCHFIQYYVHKWIAMKLTQSASSSFRTHVCVIRRERVMLNRHWCSLCYQIKVYALSKHESTVLGFESPQLDIYYVSKTSTISQQHPFMSRKWMLLPAHS